LAFAQPLTPKQISKKTGIPIYTCSYIIDKYVQQGILTCLNSKAQSSRLYWLTDTGILKRKQLCCKLDIAYVEPDLPDINWQLYGWVCFSHRSTVIKILTSAMRPSEVKRLLILQKTNIRISAGNIRDVLLMLLSKGIVRPVKVKNRNYLRYELTDLGIKLRQLLVKADAYL